MKGLAFELRSRCLSTVVFFSVGYLMAAMPAFSASAGDTTTREQAKGQPSTSSASSAGSVKSKKPTSASSDGDERTSKELAVSYQRLSELSEKATACIFDPKCLSSDRKVLQLMIDRRELLEKLATRAKNGDLEAGYWRGTIAMEQARKHMSRGEVQSDDLGSRKEALLITAFGAEEFRNAAKFLKMPADNGVADACDRMGEILANGYGMYADLKRAAEYYRCAGLGFLKEGRKDEVAQTIAKMRGFLPSNHMYIVELYAKLITREPNSPWRVPSDAIALIEKSYGSGKMTGPGEDAAKATLRRTQ
ncbi:MAG: sel1 repeat family protein [Betaproteobacteria bacterium]|nr:sel1 repeat family protein [Betaproteobacteria bacterium]